MANALVFIPKVPGGSPPEWEEIQAPLDRFRADLAGPSRRPYGLVYNVRIKDLRGKEG